jgi:hypothetical protein
MHYGEHMLTHVTVVMSKEAKGADAPSYKTTAAQVRFNQKVTGSGRELSTGTRHGQKTPPADSVHLRCVEWVDNDGQSVTLYLRLSNQAGRSRDGLMEVQGERRRKKRRPRESRGIGVEGKPFPDITPLCNAG